MALGFSVGLRSARLDAIATFAGSNALLRLYSGTKPATGGAVTTLLAELVCAATLGTSSGTATLTFNTITGDSSADANGTATWFRIVKSDGTTHVMDGTVGTSGQDLNLSASTSISVGQVINVSSFTISEANA